MQKGWRKLKNKTVAKRLKICAIVLGSLILVIVIAGVSVFDFLIKPKFKEISKVVEEVISDEEILKEIEPYLDNDELVNIINQLEKDGTSEALKEKAKEYEDEIEKDKNTENEVPDSENTTTQNSVKTPASAYDSRYDYIKDNVNVSDFAKGTSLASKIDVGYVMGLLSGGLTAEEKKELKAYLQSRLSSAEIAEGIRLYSKYSYLLSN